MVSGLATTNSYTYDIANRLVDVDGVAYTWDANGNLLNDGANTYTYDSANRLGSVSNGLSVSSFGYNGLGDRLSQVVNGVTTNYTLDLNAGLTQVLDDGTYSYTYGVGRISQQQGNTSEYFLGDALGSVRQMTDQSSAVTLAKSYDPYGNVVSSAGTGTSAYAYTGEMTDVNGLVYLRARYYASSDGRFLTRDTWDGDVNLPLSLNRWIYVNGNPVSFVDPSGNIPTKQEVALGKQVYSCNCGWIDFGHAGSQLALSIFDLLKKEKEYFPLTHYSPVIRDDVFAISPSADISIWKLYDETVSLTAVVKTGLDGATKDSVALGIFRSLEEKIENTQGDRGMWFTYYSFEDLTSDEIGFYLALKYGKVVNPANDGLTKNVNAWNYLAGVCGFPENRQQAIDRSLKVYDSMNLDSLWGDPFMRLLTDTPHVFSWGMPMLCEINGLCDGEAKQWPAEFRSIVPSQPSRNNLWWVYDRSLDGRLLSPNSEFSYVHR